MVLVRSRSWLDLPALTAVWGALNCIMASVKTHHYLLVMRDIIGIAEAGFAPGVLMLISSWYKRDEQSKRFAIFISAAILSGAFGGFLVGAITGGLEGVHGIRGWRWLFIVEGVSTIGWASISTFILLDFPATSKRLTSRERYIATTRLVDQGVTVRTSDSPKLGKRKSFMLAITDKRTWGFVLGYMVGFTRSHGISVEAESGRIEGGEDGIADTGDLEELLASHLDVEKFISAHIDILAPSIGNIHGDYGPKGPQLDMDRLESIADQCRNCVQIALHGTNDFSPELLQKCIKSGVTKINVKKLLLESWTEFVKKNVQKPLTMLMEEGIAMLQGEVERWILIVEVMARLEAHEGYEYRIRECEIYQLNC